MPRLRRLAVRLVLALLPLVSLMPLMPACQAQDASTSPDAPETVRVTGVRAIPWKSYRAMRAAMDTYEAYKDIAPNARFGFGIILPPGQKLPPNFSMRLRTAEGKEYPIQMKGNLFQLPAVPGDVRDADLVTNLKGVSVKVGVEVLTPDLPPGMDRLGDLRLYCQVMAAIDRVDEGILKRLLGPDRCTYQWFSVPLKLPTAGAALVEEERQLPLARRVDANGTFYQVPLSDATWSNDALVAFDYLEPFPMNGGSRRLRFVVKN